MSRKILLRGFASFFIFVQTLLTVGEVGFAAKTDASSATSREDRTLTEESKIWQENSRFINLPPFQVPIINANKPVGFLGMRVILEAPDPKAAAYLASQHPRLQDIIYRNIYIICDVIWDTSYNPSLLAFKKRIDTICARLIGKDLVKNVLIENLVLQRMY